MKAVQVNWLCGKKIHFDFIPKIALHHNSCISFCFIKVSSATFSEISVFTPTMFDKQQATSLYAGYLLKKKLHNVVRKHKPAVVCSKSKKNVAINGHYINKTDIHFYAITIYYSQ